MGKTALYLAYFCIYSVIMLIIGKGSMHGSSTPRDYFICERKVSLPFCVATFTGTWVSAITILSLTGSIYEEGLPVLFYAVIPWFLGAFLLALTARQLYSSAAITVPEMFWLRYHSRALQAVYGVVLIFVYIFYLVAQYKGFGLVASALFRIPYPAAVCMVYLFITYTTIGGYRSVLRTDMFHLLLLSGSLLLVCGSFVAKAGGFSALYRAAGQVQGFAHAGITTPTSPGQLLQLFGGRYTPLISLSMFWGWGLGLASNPQYLVRILSAKDSRTARNTVLVSLAILAALYFALIHIGLAMRVMIPSLPDAETTDSIFIRLINNELYGPWSGFFLFSVIGACVSTANSQLLLIASSLSYDVIRPLAPNGLPDKRVVALARRSVIGAGTIVMLLTLNPPHFTLSYGGDLWGVVAILLFPSLYGSVLTGRITLRGIWCSIAAGALSIAVFYPLRAMGRIPVHPALCGVLISTAALFFGSVTEGKDAGNVDSLGRSVACLQTEDENTRREEDAE